MARRSRVLFRLLCQAESHSLSVDLYAAMEKMGGISPQAAAANFWVLDKDGLITQQRSTLPDYVARFARPVGEGRGEGAGLLDVVEAVQPTVLLGLAGEADCWSDLGQRAGCCWSFTRHPGLPSPYSIALLGQ